jgi:PAS domain S-box-containing protein
MNIKQGKNRRDIFMAKKPSYEELEQRIRILEAELSGLTKENFELREQIARLEDTEERYRGIFEHTKNAVAVYEAVNGGEDFIFLDINNAGEKVDQIRREDVIGKSVLKMFPGVRELGLFQAFQSVWKTGNPWHIPSGIYEDERIRGWRENFVYRLPSGEIVSIYNDKTKQKQAEDALKESEERLRQVVQNMPVMLDAFDESRRINVWNRECENVTGYTAEEITSIPNPMEILYPDKKYRSEIIAEWAERGSEFYNWEMDLTRKDGNVRTVSWSNISEQFPIPGWDSWAVGVDVTQRAKAEASLRKSEAQKKAILDGISINLCFVDESLSILWANKAAASSVNKSHQEMIGYKCHQLRCGSDDPCKACPTVKAFKTRKMEQAVMRTADGKIWHEKSEPVFDDKQNLIGVVEISEDITDKVRLEAHLQQVQKMEAIASLAGGIAHQFNNALFGITGNIDLLKMILSGNEKAEKYIRAMTHSAERMTGLTRQLSAYAHGGKYEPQIISLNDFVENALPLVQHSISKSIRIRTALDPQTSQIRADVHQMQMVFLAVVSNSAEAIEGEGYIHISTGRECDGGNYAKLHPHIRLGKYISLTIKDNGKGMDDETKHRIFDPFFSTKFQGRGLSMAAAFGIIRDHDGWISVDSELGKGTAVHIFLPSAGK